MADLLHKGVLRPGRATAAALLSPAMLAVLLLVIAPALLLARFSLNRFVPGEFMVEALTLENYARFFGDPFYREVLARTVYVAAVSTVVCLVMGFLPAYYIARTSSLRLKSMLVILVILPLFMGNAVRVAGWMVLLGERGVVNAFLQATGLAAVSMRILYTETAVLLGTISVLMPFMIITLQSTIEAINPALEEAGLGLGANHWQVFRRVLLPLAMPGVLTGAVLCFILGMNAYATPVLIGGPSFHMMAPKVYEQITKANNWPFGAALAFVLMFSTLALTLLSSAVLSRFDPQRREVR